MHRSGCATFLLIVGCLVAAHPSAVGQEMKPSSPGVKRAIERGAKFLETAPAADIGHRSLLALALAKCGRDKSHPKIQEAIKTIQAATKNGPDKVTAAIYHTSVAIMCLVAVDPSRYRGELETLVKSLHLKQKDEGAWGYPVTNETHGKSCDTSMTQYALLSLWEAQELGGIETPADVWDRAASWLLLTQDPTGGYGYQGIRAEDENRVKQAGVRASMTAAGLVGVYVVKDMLGISDLRKNISDDTPATLKPYESPEQRQARIKTKTPLKYFARALNDGIRWSSGHYAITKPGSWHYYYLYAFERYESLKEVDRRGYLLNEEGPKWYTDGARYLLKAQHDLDGYWEGEQDGKIPSTCFALLFLSRSTQQNLQKSGAKRFAAALAVAGRKIPTVEDVRLRDGELVVQPLKAPIDEVLAIAGDTEHESYTRAREALADLARSGDPKALTEQARKLASLTLRGSAEVRLLAVQAIQRSRNLDLGPLLIHLLNDPDVKVAAAANDALGSFSRKFSSFSAGAQPTAEERQRAVENWRQWYAAIRPDVDLESFDPFDLLQ